MTRRRRAGRRAGHRDRVPRARHPDVPAVVARPAAAAARAERRAGSRAPSTCVEHRPRRLLGGRGRRRASSGSSCRSCARRCGCSRRTPWCPARRASGSARRCSRRRSSTAAGRCAAMLNASNDPRAVRRYHDAGFRLYPQMFLRGTARPLARSRSSRRCARARAGDIDLMDSIDRRTRGRGARRRPRDPARAVPAASSATPRPGQGYAYLDDGVALLAATNRRTAARLMWEAHRLRRRPADRPHHPRERAGPSTSGSRRGSSSHQGGYLGAART